ncbi:beta-1,3-glucuronyltransferase 3 (glucuronosyltransferase I), isoform CRA_c [Homo sapiens]|nr:beta-1,3-glucuronyltransferase 3 (glucuronosyltransferase I), isoform CRA_c [Homo sapiens]
MKLKLKNVFLAYFLVSIAGLLYALASHVTAFLPCGQQPSSYGRRI